MIFLLKCIWLDQSGKLATRRWVLYETKLIVNPILPHFASSLSCSSYFSVIWYLQLIFSSTLSCLSQLSYLSFTFKILFKLFLLAQLNPLRSHFSTHALFFRLHYCRNITLHFLNTDWKIHNESYPLHAWLSSASHNLLHSQMESQPLPYHGHIANWKVIHD